MPSPFPGMDPYLENPGIFPDFHDSFITYLREHLQARLPVPYFAALGRRVWIEFTERTIEPNVQVLRAGERSSVRETGAGVVLADQSSARPVAVKVAQDEFREPFLEIYTRGDHGKRLVASLEVLSLSNKTSGAHGRDLYVRKQKELLASQVHLVEIDLLRGGEHATAVPFRLALAACGPFDYHVSVRRFDDEETVYVYPMRLAERFPTIEIPLLPGDPPPTIDLQAVFDRCYDAGPYRREIDYDRDVITPPLSRSQAEWAERILTAKPAASTPEV
jgi:Protein of unknown function (DUF4058)